MNIKLLEWLDKQPEDVRSYAIAAIEEINPFYTIDEDKDKLKSLLELNIGNIKDTFCRVLVAKLAYLNKIIDANIYDELILQIDNWTLDKHVFLIDKTNCRPHNDLGSKLLNMDEDGNVDWNDLRIDSFNLMLKHVIPANAYKEMIKNNAYKIYFTFKYTKDPKIKEEIANDLIDNTAIIDRSDGGCIFKFDKELDQMDSFIEYFVKRDPNMLKYLSKFPNCLLNKVIFRKKEEDNSWYYSKLFIQLCATALCCNKNTIPTNIQSKLKTLIPIIKCYNYDWDTCYNYIIDSYNQAQ